ncbi:MAG TPA: hypothetical protein O0X50_01770 [Methanocorpusculum sp.]|nr:hypothetical protein [Methanocorpusculum sp.]
MAERRMFALTIIDSDAFLDLPISAQALYFHLAMRADDDGFINKPRAVMNMIGAKNDDAKILVERKFIVPFDSGVVVIKHWRIHNFIRKDTYHETKYKFEKAQLYLDENNSYSTHPQEVSVTSPLRTCNETDTQDRLGKDRLDKVSLNQEERKERSLPDLPPEYDTGNEYINQTIRELLDRKENAG